MVWGPGSLFCSFDEIGLSIDILGEIEDKIGLRDWEPIGKCLTKTLGSVMSRMITDLFGSEFDFVFRCSVCRISYYSSDVGTLGSHLS